MAALSSLSPDENGVPPEIDTSKPHAARIYDFLLGGKDNFAADREVAERTLKVWPGMRIAARENRAFLRRAVTYLAAEAGISQFLDIGSGLPTAGNVHEIARDASPGARVVYIDNDPVVGVHGRALLADAATARFVTADVRRPAEVLDDPEVQGFIDFRRPV